MGNRREELLAAGSREEPRGAAGSHGEAGVAGESREAAVPAGLCGEPRVIAEPQEAAGSRGELQGTARRRKKLLGRAAGGAEGRSSRVLGGTAGSFAQLR